MASRFDQAAFSLLMELLTLAMELELLHHLKMYENDLNMDTLNVQLSMLPDVVATANEKHHMGIKRVTTMRTVFNACRFPTIYFIDISQYLLHLQQMSRHYAG